MIYYLDQCVYEVKLKKIMEEYNSMKRDKPYEHIGYSINDWYILLFP